MNILLALLSGSLMLFAFPPLNIFIIAWFALMPFFIGLSRVKDQKEAFLFGAAFAVIFFGGILYWVTVLSQWAGAWAYIGFILLVLLQAIFLGVFAIAVLYLNARKVRFDILVVPLIWVAVEWVRSLGTFGITAGDLGYSQIDFVPLVQAARIIGVYGISFLIALVNYFLSKLAISGKEWQAEIRARRLECFALTVLFVAVMGYGFYRMWDDVRAGTAIKVSLIQASIPQDVKLDYGQVCSITDLNEVLSRKALAGKPQLIIWPETAVTTYLNLACSVQTQLEKLIKGGGAYYLIGTSHTTGSRNYNSVVAYSPKGAVIGRYNKQRLVPFGEYLLLRPLLFPLFSGMGLFAEDYHSDPAGNIIDLGIAKAGVVICFESTFPGIVRDKIRKGAQFIVVATNDAWFGRSSALDQHLRSSRMRAVENGVYVLQAANTGISAIIDPCGRVVQRSAIDDEVVLTGEIFVKR